MEENKGSWDVISISIAHLETGTWKKREAPQYGDSHLTELVRVKPVSKDVVLAQRRQECAAESFSIQQCGGLL